MERPPSFMKGRFTFPCRNGCPASVLIRPEDVTHDHNSRFQARVIHKNFRGANILYTLLLPSNDTILSLVPSHHNHNVGEKIGIIPQVEDIILFENTSLFLSDSDSSQYIPMSFLPGIYQKQ